MKKCPFCGAELADEAQFCLYCMTPLSEKETIPPVKRRPKGWLFVLGGIALLAVVIILLWPGAGNETADPVMQVTTVPSTVVTTTPTIGTTVPTTVTTAPSTSSSTTAPTTTMPTTAPTTVTTVPTTAPTTTKPTTIPTTLPTTSNGVQYLYRAAKAGDIYYSYQVSDNQIVITGIENPADDGVYHIPGSIDGKTVVAIMSNAFSGSGATTVFIPNTVKTVHDYAFNGCALTDVYFRGDAIYCYPDAFPKNFTLHTSADCHDRNLRYYKYAAANYGATWEEWNGEA